MLVRTHGVSGSGDKGRRTSGPVSASNSNGNGAGGGSKGGKGREKGNGCCVIL
jgi:hypothetical protein